MADEQKKYKVINHHLFEDGGNYEVGSEIMLTEKRASQLGADSKDAQGRPSGNVVLFVEADKVLNPEEIEANNIMTATDTARLKAMSDNNFNEDDMNEIDNIYKAKIVGQKLNPDFAVYLYEESVKEYLDLDDEELEPSKDAQDKYKELEKQSGLNKKDLKIISDTFGIKVQGTAIKDITPELVEKVFNEVVKEFQDAKK